MMHFDDYETHFPHARLVRFSNGTTEVTLHSNGKSLIFERRMHEEFADLFRILGEDKDNRAVVLTGTGKAFMDQVHAQELDFTMSRDHDAMYRSRGGALSSLLDIPVPIIAAINGAATVHTEYILLADIVLATPDARFRERSCFNIGILRGEGVRTLWSEVLGTAQSYAFVLNHQCIDAREAMSLGVVKEIVPRNSLVDRAREIAAKLIMSSDRADCDARPSKHSERWH